MKKQTLWLAVLFIFLGSFYQLFAQEKRTKDNAQKIMVTFKNNSLLPRKYTFITYSPDSDGNGTTGKMMAPNGTTSFEVLVGTKIYLANSQQVNVVMSGNKLTGKPFYVAKAEDANKTIELRKN